MEVRPVRATASRVTEDTARVRVRVRSRTAAPDLTVRDTAPATARVDTVRRRPRSPTARVALTAAAVRLLREERTVSSPPTPPTTSSSRLPAPLRATPAALSHQASDSSSSRRRVRRSERWLRRRRRRRRRWRWRSEWRIRRERRTTPVLSARWESLQSAARLLLVSSSRLRPAESVRTRDRVQSGRPARECGRSELRRSGRAVWTGCARWAWSTRRGRRLRRTRRRRI
ncbi:hypothetical protein PHYPO_G00040040 [Pangasianodon hypophthalmus]|uniref:Uncharacterized protein n=1 Tax=Pangasianodon hypophthalmus TaxID=310915 RepID=A0A5N5MH49_PANHP|nr:hypothetical protein PHYPO_G00040040 [Pangasianodon hypophthalmus]